MIETSVNNIRIVLVIPINPLANIISTLTPHKKKNPRS